MTNDFGQLICTLHTIVKETYCLCRPFNSGDTSSLGRCDVDSSSCGMSTMWLFLKWELWPLLGDEDFLRYCCGRVFCTGGPSTGIELDALVLQPVSGARQDALWRGQWWEVQQLFVVLTPIPGNSA